MSIIVSVIKVFLPALLYVILIILLNHFLLCLLDCKKIFKMDSKS